MLLARVREVSVSTLQLLPSLREYQREAVRFITEAHAGGANAVYFVLPTGAGKTHILGDLARRYGTNGRVLALVHRTELCAQIAERFAAFGVPMGTLAGGRETNFERSAMVAIVDSLTPKRLAAYVAGPPVSLILVDEAHHAVPGSRYATILAAIRAQNPEALFVGCTATPARMDSKRLTDLFPRCVFSRDIEDLAALGVLAKPMSVTLHLPKLHLTSIRTSSGDYAPSALADEMLRSASATVEASLQHVRGELGLAFAASVLHARRLNDAYRKAGIPSDVILGETSPADRARHIAAWRERGHGLLLNVGCLTEGFDEPRASVVVIAAPTQSTTKYLQIIGRVLRVAPGKTTCTIVDVMGRDVDPRQVLLDSVLLHGMGESANNPADERNPLGALGRKHAKNAWLPVLGGSALGIGKSLIWFVQRDAHGSGLWEGRLLDAYGVQEHLTALPLPELAEMIHRAIVSNGPNALTLRHAPWRDEPASDRSLDRLRRESSTHAAIVATKRWTAGRVSDAITIASATRLLRRLERVSA